MRTGELEDLTYWFEVLADGLAPDLWDPMEPSIQIDAVDTP